MYNANLGEETERQLITETNTRLTNEFIIIIDKLVKFDYIYGISATNIVTTFFNMNG